MADPQIPERPERPPEATWATLRSIPRGSEVEILREEGIRLLGTLVLTTESPDRRMVQIKLPSGYNLGIRWRDSDRLLAHSPPPPARGNAPVPGHPPPASGAPSGTSGWIGILSTGGTIASRVDYRTGGVRPVQEEGEMLQFYPDLDRDGPVRVIPVLDRLSEEIVPTDWIDLARRVADCFRGGARGVVVTHGTDTMAYTAAALAFTLSDLPGPVVLVGAQRSPDRPSSDGYPNLLAAVRLARRTDLGEVVVVMHSGLSDQEFAIHRAARVRKMHTSRRDAFRSRNGPPLGILSEETVAWSVRPTAPGPGPVRIDDRIDPRGCLLWVYPGLPADRARALAEGCRGIIVAGTGLGHTASTHLPWIRNAIRDGAFVGMTSQCLEGAVDPFVYATGRMLLDAGVAYLGDMLPEVAYTKLLLALGRSGRADDVAAAMLRDWSGEVAHRRQVTGQGDP